MAARRPPELPAFAPAIVVDLAAVREAVRNTPRHKRPREVSPQSIHLDKIPRRHLALVREEDPEALARHLPATRGDCESGPRPCPYVSCRHHLLIDSMRGGGFKILFPDLVDIDPETQEVLDVRLEEMPATCALDVADQGGVILEVVAHLLNCVRERVRQIEANALSRIGRSRAGEKLRSYCDDDAEPRDRGRFDAQRDTYFPPSRRPRRRI